MRVFNNCKNTACVLILLVIALLAPRTASADLILDVSIKEVYEDNVNAALSGANANAADVRGGGAAAGGAGAVIVAAKSGDPPNATTGSTTSTGTGDFYTVLSLALGASTPIDPAKQFYLKGELTHYQFSKFTDLDSTIVGINTGIIQKFSDIVSAQVAVKAKEKNYNNDLRDSTAYIGSLNLKQKLTPAFSIKEEYEYEQNNAKSDVFSYTGHTLGVSAGYKIVPKTTLNIGYSLLMRKFKDATGSRTTDHIISAGVEAEISKNWYATATYDHDSYDSNVSGVSNTDNTYAVGLTYNY